MMFQSEIECLGEVAFPEPAGVRVMMMPFLVHAPGESLPSSLGHIAWLVERMCAMATAYGTGYLTIDEAVVQAGETHRRPGLHVDGIGPDGMPGGWGGGGGGWAKRGMLVAASVTGCRGWVGEIDGEPGPNGDCSHLRDQLGAGMDFEAGKVYWCGPLAVHESLPLSASGWRQFVRVSMPNDAPWYEGYTPNPLGIQPAGPTHPPRSAFMGFRP